MSDIQEISKLSNEYIKVGDRVNVMFDNVPWIFDAEVLYIPAVTGDCWRLKTMITPNTIQIHYVQTFAKMETLLRNT